MGADKKDKLKAELDAALKKQADELKKVESARQETQETIDKMNEETKRLRDLVEKSKRS